MKDYEKYKNKYGENSYKKSEYEDYEKYKKAKKRMEEVKGFYSHLITYILINILLFIINCFTSYGNWWFLWVAVFWGIGLLFHYLGIFVLEYNIFGKRWQEKKIKEYMKDEED